MIKILLALCLLWVTAVQAESWHFNVFLGDSKIGKHTFDLNGNTLKSKAVFDVDILFINAYHYDHEATEQWQGNCLQSLNATTDDNGDAISVRARASEIGLLVTKNQTDEIDINNACTMTFAYWNPVMLQQKQLLNPQNAEYLDTDIQLVGEETITVKKEAIRTQHYRLIGRLNGKMKLNIDLWYNSKNEWVQLKSTTLDNKILTYKLI